MELDKQPKAEKTFSIIGIILALAIFSWVWNNRYNSNTSGAPVVETRIMMDTLVTIKLYNPPPHSEAASLAFAAMEQVDRMASFYRADSELSALNSTAKIPGHPPFIPSVAFMKLLQQAELAFHETKGWFDPTCSALLRAYGFYDQQGRFPSDEELQECLRLVGWSKLVQIATSGVYLATGVQIDLGGVAGGYAIERAIDVLRAQKLDAFFIDDGGDLWMEGQKPDGTPWRIAVRDPRDGGQLAIVESYQPMAISTSGDYERFVMAGDKRINHIFDPYSGKPANHYRSVTVIASSPFAADIWSTALFAMPPNEASKAAQEAQIPALFLPASGSSWVSPLGKIWFKNVRP